MKNIIAQEMKRNMMADGLEDIMSKIWQHMMQNIKQNIIPYTRQNNAMDIEQDMKQKFAKERKKKKMAREKRNDIERELERQSIEIWAEREICRAELGDRRRNNRAMKIAVKKEKNSEGAMTTNCDRNDAQLTCRFFDREEVTFDSITSGHLKRTVERCKEYDTVFVVQDTTPLLRNEKREMRNGKKYEGNLPSPVSS